jgi:hypothetical protein
LQTPRPEVLPDSLPDALVGPVGSASPSPRTDEGEIRRPPTPPESPQSIASLGEMITEAVRTVFQLCRYQCAVPREVYSRIISDQEPINTANSDEWSDGSIWLELLETGATRSRKSTVLNMLEYMGAFDWYDRQLKRERGEFLTKCGEHEGDKVSGKQLGDKVARSHTLNRLQGLPVVGKSMNGVGRLTTIEEGEEDIPLVHNSSIAERTRQMSRSQIRMYIGRGRKLREVLVKELGLGILFSPKIW